jgi:prepilin-type N-terminal cleavage/methylation domain-containing protein
MQPNRIRRQAGFTLLEVTISAAILSVVMGAVAVFQQRSEAATSDMLVRAHAERAARAALDRVAEELTGVGLHQLSPDPTSTAGSETITYQKPVSVSAAGVVTWSTSSRIALAMDDGETNNGVDDDGDGLIDERKLVLTRDLGLGTQQVVTLVHGLPELVPGESANVVDDNGNGVVDERGFNVQRTGDLLTLRLCLQRRAKAGNTITVYAQTAVVLHN